MHVSTCQTCFLCRAASRVQASGLVCLAATCSQLRLVPLRIFRVSLCGLGSDNDFGICTPKHPCGSVRCLIDALVVVPNLLSTVVAIIWEICRRQGCIRSIPRSETRHWGTTNTRIQRCQGNPKVISISIGLGRLRSPNYRHGTWGQVSCT